MRVLCVFERELRVPSNPEATAAKTTWICSLSVQCVVVRRREGAVVHSKTQDFLVITGVINC